MSKTNHSHPNHPHQHGPDCGHIAIKHGDHADYLHDSHLHHVEKNGVSEHVIPVTAQNPAACTADQPATGHGPEHIHGENCGHAAIPHGDHTDYLVDGKLHHPHGQHCDDHGEIQLA